MSCLNSVSSAGNSLAERIVDAGKVDVVDHGGALRAQLGDGRVGDRVDHRHIAAAPPHADPLAAQRIRPKRAQVVAVDDGPGVACRRVGRVDALDHREHGGRVGHVAGHRPGRVLLRRDRDDAAAADQAEGGLDADDVVGAGRADDRAVGLGADGDRGQVRGGGDRRAAAGAARVAVEDVRVVGLPAPRGPSARRRGGPEVGPLGEVRLAQDDRAGGAQLATRNASAGPAPTRASEPAVVCSRSAVPTLSLSSTGMPSSGLRAPCTRAAHVAGQSLAQTRPGWSRSPRSASG